MSHEEHETADEVVPDEEPDAALEPDEAFGEQDEAAQEDEWHEDAQEGGSHA